MPASSRYAALLLIFCSLTSLQSGKRKQTISPQGSIKHHITKKYTCQQKQDSPSNEKGHSNLKAWDAMGAPTALMGSHENVYQTKTVDITSKYHSEIKHCTQQHRNYREASGTPAHQVPLYIRYWSTEEIIQHYYNTSQVVFLPQCGCVQGS